MARIPEGTVTVDVGTHTVIVRLNRKDWNNRSGLWNVLREILGTTVPDDGSGRPGKTLGARICEPPRGELQDVDVARTTVRAPGRAAARSTRNGGTRMSRAAAARGRKR